MTPEWPTTFTGERKPGPDPGPALLGGETTQLQGSTLRAAARAVAVNAADRGECREFLQMLGLDGLRPRTLAQGDAGIACPCGGRMLYQRPTDPSSPVMCPRCGLTPLGLVTRERPC